jgi:hypothetical protein
MGAPIDRLFPQDQSDAIRTLWEDKSSQLLLEQEIGKRLISFDGIIEELPLAQWWYEFTIDVCEYLEHKARDAEENN